MVGLSILNPEPVVNRSYLEFYGDAKSEPLLSLLIDNPDAEQFNAFVDTLKQRALEESDTFANINPDSKSAGLAANIYDEPPEFKEPDHDRLKNKAQQVKAVRVEESIMMLEQFMVAEDIRPLLTALEALKTDPHNESYFAQLEDAFNELGILQGAVLTYAPYISILIADDPHSDY